MLTTLRYKHVATGLHCRVVPSVVHYSSTMEGATVRGRGPTRGGQWRPEKRQRRKHAHHWERLTRAQLPLDSRHNLN